MRFTYSIILGILAAVFIFYLTDIDDPIDYSTQVKPILNKHCISCHGGVKKNAGFSLLFKEEALADTENGHPAIIPGNASESPFIQRLKETDPEMRMPYKKPPLPKDEIKILEAWVNQGAKWGKHWAYEKITSVEPPEGPRFASLDTEEQPFFQNEIDKFIYSGLLEHNLTPSNPADTAILLRRLSLDITGLPPLDRWKENYRSGKWSYEILIDTLLASENYGEHWASWWLDLARFADTKGYEKDPPRAMWRYRDWVIKAFNENKPFDEFTIEQLAGDLLPNPTNDQWIATAFHRNTMNNTEGGTDNEEFRVAAVVDRVNTTFEVWQSTTFACVQCHSHPYDPFKHEEYYEVMAFFNNSRDEDTNDNEPNLRLYNKEQEADITEISNWLKDNQLSPKEISREITFLKTLEPKISPDYFSDFHKGELIDTKWLGLRNTGHCMLKNTYVNDADQIIFYYNAYQNRGKLTIRQNDEKGEILAEIPINKTGGKKIEIFPFKPKKGYQDLYFEYSNPALEEQQNSFYVEWLAFHKSLPGKDKNEYPSIQQKFNKLLESTPPLQPVMVENPEHRFRETRIFENGNWMALGEEVHPDVPESLNDFPADADRTRLGLAQWLVDENNPLTARTLVNRIWAQIFGQGLVRTLEDMGTQSDIPEHRKLMDWLSHRLIYDHQWDVKALIKDIVMSGTYRQSSKSNSKLRSVDPYNQLYARGPRFRLSAEQIRDQALFVSKLLSGKMYGPSVMPPQPEGIWKTVYSGEKWITSEGEDRYRRGLYTFIRRTSPYPSFISFDAGSREICEVQRLRTNTPLQALVTLNDPVYLEAAVAMATQLLEQRPESIDSAIERAYKNATLQALETEKLTPLKDLYESSLQHFEENPEAVSEFLDYYKEDFEKSKKIAAMAVVCNAIMNLDEFITKT